LAEDIHQETWAEAIDHIDSFASDRGDLRGWILGIARRRVALHYRRRAVESTADSKQLPRDQSLLPEDVAARVELGSAVRAALLCLPDDHHAVIADKYLLGLSMDEIAAKSGKTTKAVEGLLTRARQQLRTLLKPYARAQRKG
jgi:RNA polymerase sigma-70 factor (ECF subfamily)